MTVIFFIIGAVIGSFLNVCIYRIPRRESVAWPASHCPSCGYILKWYDLVPIVSYGILGGKCRQCRSHISLRYPVVEALTGSLFTSAFLLCGLSPLLLSRLVFICLLVVIALIDLEHFIIPNRIVLPGTVLGLILTIFTGNPTLLNGVLAALGAAAFFFLIWFFYPQGMGEGDIKLALMLGSFLGWPLVGVAVFLASLTGTLGGIFIILFKGGGRKTPVPFGLYLAIGSITTLFFGDQLVTWYFKFIGL